MEVGVEGDDGQCHERPASVNATKQLALPVRLPDQANFEAFFPGPNQLVIDHLKALASSGSEKLIWIWGSAASGKTHLLQASCAFATRSGRRAAYLPVGANIAPGMLEGLEEFDLVCLDDIDRVSGDANWEQALFAFFNGLAEHGGAMVLSARNPAGKLSFALPDLLSRLAWGPTYRIESLSDDDLPFAMAHRARCRGLELPEETAQFLLRRFPRDMHSIYRLLDTLDIASLQAKRRLTVPFVRQVLENERR